MDSHIEHAVSAIRFNRVPAHELALDIVEAQVLGIPQERQQKAYSCGAAALRSALGYFGVRARSERELRALLGTDKDGTDAEDIASLAQSLGLSAEVKGGLSLEDLEGALALGKLPIVCFQAWPDNPGEPRWKDRSHNGHWAVVRAVQAGHVSLMDPALDAGRSSLREEDFLRRWHGEDGSHRQAVLVGPPTS